ncbi:SMP-30/gluconolactonase/LRE family protein [Antarcticibacterium sp. 1MA-6-2]|uniref:Vgb family protein n=1 Tax=Antarcticibacterium sp. 1MA-6-2 TaxID=2908210 RepID=UPI001F17E8FE|nr:SMP-30/gluconolactonase/LRE family protein [Antarcticibacterium sp. 1MA-6-2]UJH91607.1 SMP-30/gluconolactonase/LRE family protein [Antarcticibacterium sp. 1MA-6-2]
MKTIFLKVFLICFLFTSHSFFAQTNAKLLFKAGGFSHPESVIYDGQNNVMYVSNMADDKDGDGFISKITSEGEIIELKWITGLKDPKGLLIHNDKLYVTNNTEVVEIDIDQGQISRKIPVEGAVSLNDITADENGAIYFSDMGQNTIYKIPGKMKDQPLGSSGKEVEIEEYLKTPKLNTPNGLLVHENHLYVGSWGENHDGNLLRINLETKEVGNVTNEGIGNLDGIQEARENSFYVSDWGTGTIYKIDKEGNFSEAIQSEKSSGDILFLQEKNQLILPMNFQNEIWGYQINL